MQSHADFLQQQSGVIRNEAIHAARYQRHAVDTTYLLDTLSTLISHSPADSVTSNALVDAMRAIEAEIDSHTW